MGITDTAMLRPQVFALQEGDASIGLIASEKQANRLFKHDAGLKDLFALQAQVNAALDLDKNEHQLAPDDPGDSPEVDQPQTFPARVTQDRAPLQR